MPRGSEEILDKPSKTRKIGAEARAAKLAIAKEVRARDAKRGNTVTLEEVPDPPPKRPLNKFSDANTSGHSIALAARLAKRGSRDQKRKPVTVSEMRKARAQLSKKRLGVIQALRGLM